MVWGWVSGSVVVLLGVLGAMSLGMGFSVVHVKSETLLHIQREEWRSCTLREDRVLCRTRQSFCPGVSLRQQEHCRDGS